MGYPTPGAFTIDLDVSAIDLAVFNPPTELASTYIGSRGHNLMLYANRQRAGSPVADVATPLFDMWF